MTAITKDTVAVGIYRAGGSISDLHAENLIKLVRRYRRAYEEGNESGVNNMRTAILATLEDAGLSGWEVVFMGEEVLLTPPQADTSIYL